MKANCWEVMACGREPGGANADELGVCPAATDAIHDGKNGGRNGGRYCWKVAGTLCGGAVQGTFASKVLGCADCEFSHQVTEEEHSLFLP